MSDIVLETRQLSKHFGDLRAVDGVDLRVRRGEVYGFLGPNGAGKTTTIGMMLGLLRPTGGQVWVLGERLTPARVAPLRGVGSLVGMPAMVPGLSARENLRILAQLDARVDAQRVEEILGFVGLAGAADRAFKTFSLGMKQRMGLAAALLHRPELLILDEPTNGLDPAGMREIRELLGRLAADGVTVFLSSHLLHEIEQVCDRVAVLNHGKVVAEGAVQDLLGGQAVVRARVPLPAEAARVMRDLDGVADVTPNGQYVHVKGVAPEDVILFLVRHHIVPSEVVSSKADLESVFLQLTQEGSAAA